MLGFDEKVYLMATYYPQYIAAVSLFLFYDWVKKVVVGPLCILFFWYLESAMICSMHVLYDFCIFIFQVRSKYKGTIYTNFDQILVVFFNSVALLVILMRHECTNSAKYYIA